MQVLIDAIKNHPVTCAILVLYSGNVAWYLWRGQWGLATYWSAASLITVSATWLRDWGANG